MISIFKNKLTQTQLIALGFFILIMLGTLLLMLPISSRVPGDTSFLDALFTATSATCVTGLVVQDTFQHWTIFGQVVILLLIQIGGLGFMTIGVCFALLLRKRIDLKQRGLLQESVNTLEIGGIVRLTRKIIKGTILIEGIGAFLLFLRFYPELEFGRALYYGVFHAISAFCNAGFDLMGREEAYISLVGYQGDILVNLVIMSLIVIGGIGFVVWDDLSKKKWHFKKYMLHTKIVLSMTFLLIFGGAILFYLFERNNIMQDMPLKNKILSSLFCSITPRTAGFNTVDIAALSEGSKLLTLIFMFIGGSPGSTAGGVKTTSVAVILLFLYSNIKNTSGCNVFKRRLPEDSVKKATAVCSTNLILALSVALLICGIDALPLTDVLLEVFSAIGTVGMTTGITRELGSIARIFIILLMYFGRIGSLSFALSFTSKKEKSHLLQPTEKIVIG